MAVWTINGDGSYASTPGYGPIAGWSCTGLAVGPDDLTRVLWVHNGDHVFSMWTLHTDGSIASTPAIVPSAGYVPVSLAMDGYGVGRVLMSDSQGDSQIEDLLPDNASSGVLMTLPVGHIAGTGLTAGYTGDGLRAWKQTDAGARTYSLYDGADPIAELDGSGNLQAVNTFGAQGLVSRHTTATNASVFYTFDERGNVAQRLGSSGPALSADLYDAFGARTGTAAPNDPWGFGAQWGYQSDAETGLVLCTNRYYDPQQGRFLTRDPLGYAGGVNLYGYTGNNPVNWSDPMGLATIYLHLKPVKLLGKQHTYLVVTDTDPAHSKTGIRGGPEGFALDTSIYVWIAPYYDKSFPDHQGTPEAGKPILLVNDDKPASYYLNKFRNEANLINKLHIPYNADANSNTVISDMLKVAGISCPRPPAKAQGFTNSLGIDDDPPDNIQRNGDYTGWGNGMKQGR